VNQHNFEGNFEIVENFKAHKFQILFYAPYSHEKLICNILQFPKIRFFFCRHLPTINGISQFTICTAKETEEAPHRQSGVYRNNPSPCLSGDCEWGLRWGLRMGIEMGVENGDCEWGLRMWMVADWLMGIENRDWLIT
jgi:hypothetical protein